jgi:hypothetical protein
VAADARLPNPPILTCNEPVPLRLLVRKVTESSETIFLQMLQVELVAYTKILAHDLNRTETGSWVIMSRSNMNMPLAKPGDPVGTELPLDASLWNRWPLPNTVAPSFETCNIERKYELEVRVGLTHGSPGSMNVRVFLDFIMDLSDFLIASAHCSSLANAGQGLFRNRSSASPVRRTSRGILTTFTSEHAVTPDLPTQLASKRRSTPATYAPTSGHITSTRQRRRHLRRSTP